MGPQHVHQPRKRSLGVSHAMMAAVFILYLYPRPSFAKTTYYIDYVHGDDTSTGTSPSTPWKTWFNLQGDRGSKFKPGDSILFKRGVTWKRSDYLALYPNDIYSKGKGAFRPGSLHGTAGNEIVFGAYGTKTGSGRTENRPILDGDNAISGVNTLYAGYWGSGVEHVIFRDIELTNSVDKTTGGYIATIYSGPSCHHITFYNCYFDATHMNTTQYPDENETLTTSVAYLTVDHCFFYGEAPYNRHAAYSGGDHPVFKNNWVKGFGVSGLKFNGDKCRYGIMTGNIIINSSCNIMVGETDHADIYGNISIFTSTAIGSNNHFRVEDDDPNGGDGQYPKYNKIYNNTFISNGTAGGTLYRYRKSGGKFDVWDTKDKNDIQNNIFYRYNEHSDYMLLMTEGVTHPVPASHNLYFSDGAFRWKNNSTTYTTLASWKTSTNAPS